MGRGLACSGALVGVLVLGRVAAAAGPVGTLVVDCTGIEGWAQEPDAPDALIDVHLYFDGPAGDPVATAIVVTASTVLDGGCMGAECMHGYRSALPMSLLDAADHEVHAYGIDLTGDPNLELAGSPAQLSCPPPPVVGGELRHVVSPEILAAWQFSIFFDRLLVPDAAIMALPVGPVVDVGPQLRVDDAGGLWLVDQGRRRALAPDVAPAWRLGPAAAQPLAPAELALPEGTAVRPRPVLLQGTMPEVWLLDDHQCSEGDPDPACVPEGEDDTGGGSTDGDAGTGAGSSDTGPVGSSEGSGTGGEGTGGTSTGPAPAVGDEGHGGCGCGSRERSGSGWLAALGLLVMLGGAQRLRAPGRYMQPSIGS